MILYLISLQDFFRSHVHTGHFFSCSLRRVYKHIPTSKTTAVFRVALETQDGKGNKMHEHANAFSTVFLDHLREKLDVEGDTISQ